MVAVKRLDRIDLLTCSQCGAEYQRLYGGVYEDDRLMGIYSAELHSRDHDRRIVLSVTAPCWNDQTESWEQQGVTLEVWPTETECQMMFQDAANAPHHGDKKMGRLLDRDEALASPDKERFLALADTIMDHDTRVRAYLGVDDSELNQAT